MKWIKQFLLIVLITSCLSACGQDFYQYTWKVPTGDLQLSFYTDAWHLSKSDNVLFIEDNDISVATISWLSNKDFRKAIKVMSNMDYEVVKTGSISGNDFTLYHVSKGNASSYVYFLSIPDSDIIVQMTTNEDYLNIISLIDLSFIKDESINEV